MYVLVMLMANPPSVLPIVPIMQSQFLLRQEKTHYLFRDSGFLFGAGYRNNIQHHINLILNNKVTII